MRRQFPSRLAESFFLRPACALVLALLTPGAVYADTWSGIGSDWFASTSWFIVDFNSGPPSSTENAFFPDNESGFPLAVTNVQLSASTTISLLNVESPLTKQYTFTGANGAVLSATQQMSFLNSDLQSLNVHTIASLRLNTPTVAVFQNAILSLNNSTVTTNSIQTLNDGRIDVNSGSSVQTLGYYFDQSAGEMRVNSGGELRIAGDTTLQRGTTTINSGGQLNALSGVDLEYNGTALLQFFSGHSVDNAVHLKATGGGDITSTSFIDVGNNQVGSLTVTGAGTTLTAGGSISDWGSGSAGNATVTIADSAVATINSLRAGTGNSQFIGNVTGGATLRTTGSFTMGGDPNFRTVSLDVNAGTLETNALATFNNRADLNLVSGTVAFNGGATFNSGSRIDWTGGALSLGASSTLLVDAGVVNRTLTGGFIFSDNTTTRIRNGGSFITPSYFDLGNAKLDMNNGTLNVGTTGGTISDWGGSGATTTATLANNAVATYNSGLRMGVLGSGGTTSATISGGARLVSNGSLSTGGTAASNVTLNVTGGRVESNGLINLDRGTTTNISAAGVMEAQSITIGSSGGMSSSFVSGTNSLLKSLTTLSVGRQGTGTITISSDGKVESLGSTVIGELAGSTGSVAVLGSGSRLDVGSSLTIGSAGTGSLDIQSGGFVPVSGAVTIGSLGTLDLAASGSLETSVGQTITNNGLIRASDGSQIRADIVNAGTLRLLDASTTRNVTLQANSVMTTDNSTVGSLTHQSTADLKFTLRSLADFDNLGVTSAASLGGDIVVSLDNAFVPALGNQFQILTASSITGAPTFDFSAAPLGSGLSWLTIQLPTSLTLAVVPAGTPGDFDNDGDVDGRDFLRWQRGQSTNTFSPGDLATWQAEYNGGSLMAASIAVPEPSTFVLLFGLVFVRNRALN